MSTSAAVPGDDDEEVLVLEGLGHRRVFTRRSVKHMIAGSLLGFFLSLTLSSILYELARPANLSFKATDVLVLAAACIALFAKQFRAQVNMTKSGAMTGSFQEPETRMIAVVKVGAACVGTGSVCVFLFCVLSFLPPVAKFFLILNISAAHCFLLCLGAVEFFNRWLNDGSPLIARQLYTVVIASLGVGCMSGFFFGIVDVEKNYDALAWEEWVAAAVCMLSGAAVGHANSEAVDDQMEIAFDPLPMEETAKDDAATTGAPSAAAAASATLPTPATSSASLRTVVAAASASASATAAAAAPRTANLFADDE